MSCPAATQDCISRYFHTQQLYSSISTLFSKSCDHFTTVGTMDNRIMLSFNKAFLLKNRVFQTRRLRFIHHWKAASDQQCGCLPNTRTGPSTFYLILDDCHKIRLVCRLLKGPWKDWFQSGLFAWWNVIIKRYSLLLSLFTYWTKHDYMSLRVFYWTYVNENCHHLHWKMNRTSFLFY